MRWGRRAPPVPAAAGVNLLRSPAPGGGGGREGEGARAAGGSARGRRTRQRTGPARNRPEPPRAGGGAAGAPPPRNGPRAAEGGMAGRAPRVGAGPTGGRQRLPRPPRSGPRAAPPGARAGDSGPPPRRGLPMRPTLFAPAQTPGGGEHGAGGARSGGQGGGSRRKAGPQLRPPDAPLQGAPSPRDGDRRKRKAPRPWPGRFREGKLLAESTPCGSIVPQRRRCCQAPEGGGPLLDIRTLFRQRGALTGHCLGLPRPGRDDVP